MLLVTTLGTIPLGAALGEAVNLLLVMNIAQMEAKQLEVDNRPLSPMVDVEAMEGKETTGTMMTKPLAQCPGARCSACSVL